MSVLADHQIRVLAKEGMIEPFTDGQEKLGGVTAGLGPASYDVRLGEEFAWVVKSRKVSAMFDPSKPLSEGKGFVWVKSSACGVVIQPGDFILGHTAEVITLPEDVVARVADKSTWARLGLQVKNTLIDPGFSGQVTLEFANEGPLPIKLTAGVGIAQIVFEQLASPCEKPYCGRYMDQRGVVIPKGTDE